MENNNNSRRTSTLAAIAILLLIGTGIFLGFQLNKNGKLEADLKNEKLSAESLLSQKLSLDKEMLKIRTDLKQAEAQRAALDKSLADLTSKLDAAERDLKSIQRQNGSVSQLKKQIQELSTQRDGLERQIAQSKASLSQLQESNDDLQKMVALLQQQNHALSEELNSTRLAIMNDMLVASTKRNSKLTVKARRTNQLVVDMDVAGQAENLSFKVINPAGVELTDNHGSYQVQTIVPNKKASQAFYVAPTSSLPAPSFKRIQMTYQAKQKLSPGIYHIEVLSNSRSIGSLQVKLR
jgi:myosin heavy subunit